MFDYKKSYIPCSCINDLKLKYSPTREFGEEAREIISSARVYYDLRKRGCCDSEALCGVIDTYPDMKKYISKAIRFSFRDILDLFKLRSCYKSS